jgi:hypothetical protein
VDGVFELRHDKFAKCLVIIQFGIAIIISKSSTWLGDARRRSRIESASSLDET